MADETINIKIQEDGSRVVKRSLDDIAASADKAQTPIQRMTQSLKSIVMPNTTKQAMDAAKTSAEQLGAQGVATAASQRAVQNAISATEQVAVSRFASIRNATLGAFDTTRDAAAHWAGTFKNSLLNAYDTVRDAGYYWATNFKGFLGAGGAATVEKEASTIAAATPKIRSSSLAIREMFVIAREASVGNFTRMAGSISILAGAFGLLYKALIPLIVVLAVAAGALKLFQVSIQSDADNQLKQYSTTLGLTSKEMRKLGDESVGAKGKLEKFNTIKLTFGDVFKGLTKTISDTFNLSPVMTTMKNDVYGALVAIVKGVSEAAAQIYAAFYAAFIAIGATWSNLPGVLDAITTEAANGVLKIINDMINNVIDEWNRGANKLADLFGAKHDAPVAHVQFEAKNLSKEGDRAQKIIEESYGKGFAQATAAERKFYEDWKKNSIAAGDNRLKALADAIKENRNPSKQRDPKTQADYINDEISKLDMELSRMKMLKDAREEQQKLDTIEEAFIKRRMPLNDAQIKVFADKIHAIQEFKYQQAEMDRITEAADGPQRTYNASLKAADDLLQRGAISSSRYALEVANASRALEASKDLVGANQALRDYQQKLDEIKYSLVNFGITQAQADQQTVLAERAYKGATDPLFQMNEQLRAAEVAATKYGDAVQENNFYEQIRQQFLAHGIVLSQEYVAGENAKVDSIMAGNRALQQEIKLQEMLKGIIDPNLQGPQGDQKILADASKLYAELEKLRGKDFKSEQRYAAAKAALDKKLAQTRLENASTMFGNLATLADSKNREIAAIGKAAAVAQATIDGILAVQKALSAYPPPWNIAIAASIGVAAAANVAKILGIGFEGGGYTGDGATNQVAGVVHGKEFVFDASATNRIGVQTLEAIRLGRTPPSQAAPASAASRRAMVIVHQHPGTVVEEVHRSDGEIELIARRVTRSEVPKVNQQELANPNSPTSKALNRHTTAGRKR